MIKYFKILLIIGFGYLFTETKAQESEGKIRILFIFDGSNSMNAQWEKSSKISIAKSLMIQTMDSLRSLENIELALRIYGHQSKILPGKQDCSDTNSFDENKNVTSADITRQMFIDIFLLNR